MGLPPLSHIALDSPEIRAKRKQEAEAQLSHPGVSRADKIVAKRILALCEAMPTYSAQSGKAA